MKAKAKDVKKPDRNAKPENTEALKKVKSAKKELEAYFTENKLDPTKDYSKDKKHGKKIKELMAIIEVNREKVKDSTGPEKHHKKSEDKNKKPKAVKAKELPTDSRKVTKYDYPLVDGKEMTAEEKKKYRIKMRKEENKGSKTEKVKKEKPVEKSKKEKKAKVKTKAKEPEKKKKVLKKKKKSDD